MFEPKCVTVIGLGYVGCVTAACLAEIGHVVCGIDRDSSKVARILAGQSPFYEPGLDDLVAAMVRAGRFTATTSTAEALRDADIAMIAVGTPSLAGGDISLEQLRRVLSDLAPHLEARFRPLIIAVRSTVPPGTCEELVAPALRQYRYVSVVSNPEFLREGSAVSDFRTPSLVVVGGTDPEAVRAVAGVYAPLGVPPSLVAPRTAEMIKFACNAFHALKISFANEIGALCGRLQIDAHEVMRTLCEDSRLNISPAYLRPGFAFGGSCLSKDLRALTASAARLSLNVPLLEATLPSNQEHLRRAVARVLETPRQRIGVLGLAFKENTDDLRESPVVMLIRCLLEHGRTLKIFDPHVRLHDIYGSNREFILEAIPEIDGLISPSIDDMLNWAECIVLTQKPSPELAGKIKDRGLPLIDLSGTVAELDNAGESSPVIGHCNT